MNEPNEVEDARTSESAMHPEEDDGPEPVAAGTLFILILFLMALAGLWAILYVDLLQR